MSVLVDNIWKAYGDKSVLEGVRLDIAAGSFVTMVGASGCGKSTFLRMLLGAETPTRGAIEIEGKPMPPEPGMDRGIVFQRYSVFPHLNCRDNVMLGLAFRQSPIMGRLFGKAKKAASDEAQIMLDAVGLEHAGDLMPSALSGGMQQRLAIAQALILKPKILLLDEPFGALDPGIRLDMHELVIRLWRQTGMTVFMVTHDLSEAFKLGTRVLTFDKTRHDPHVPDAYGARITYDLPGFNQREP